LISHKERDMRKVVIAGVLLAALAACNTVEGAGRDITAAGKAVAKTASDTLNHK
jgi:predicted small secreted protein